MTVLGGRLGAALIFVSYLACTACAARSAAPAHAPVTVPTDGTFVQPAFVQVPPEEGIVVEGEPAGGTELAPYKLDIEDVLDISIYGEDDLQHVDVTVRPDGMISYAFVGDVQAFGRTVEEVRQDITKRISQYLRSPQVTIIAKEFAQKKIYIGGEVKAPGILNLTGREGTLLDALYKAGLVTDKASLENAYVMRGNQIVSTDFKDLVRGNHTRNIRLRDRDTIYIPENVERYIYVLGEFGQNAAVETQEPIPIIQAIARAGGLEKYAAKDRVIVVRGGLKNPSIATVDAKKLVGGDLTQNILVKPGDIVYVGLSGRGKFNEVLQQILLTIAPIVQGVIVTDQVNP
ncbi:MAG: polysaccharide biosynthesis/export family protein [Candidatus Polarisedimenticolia bacterium]